MYHYVLQYIDYQRIAVLWCYRIVGHVLSIASCVVCDFYFPKRSVGAHSQVFWDRCLRWYLNLTTRTVVWPKLICFITAQSVIRGKDKYLVDCKDTLWTFWPQLVPWTFLFFSLMIFACSLVQGCVYIPVNDFILDTGKRSRRPSVFPHGFDENIDVAMHFPPQCVCIPSFCLMCPKSQIFCSRAV